ncbi:hypothetical protein JIG36_41580 [Actinoplanes sp. LDG1-06]|uniref:CYTH domain-containing protein n=1 Tax=Paractinoplanes ovalisporus TaxID=2810368 RepID=A0ABS2AQB8_9ACTN|nr:hypothetical protein [Actinoplanes ovalisporus]MBM2622014.1 hypothetical protein [Actinoplanes ovalisporus]
MTETLMTNCFWQPPLTGQVPKVELKVAVSAGDLRTLGADLSSGLARKVYFLDTIDLALQRHGLIVRLRSNKAFRSNEQGRRSKGRSNEGRSGKGRSNDGRVNKNGKELGRKGQGKGRCEKGLSGDAVVKLRPVLPKALPGWLRRDDGFAVEIDALPDNYACSGTLKRHLGHDEVDRAVASGKPLARLLSNRQKRLLTAYANVPLNTLLTFGPVEVRRCRLTLAALDFPLVAERWTFPDGSVIAELSTRCATEKAPEVADQASSALRAYGIVPDDEPQVTKTEATLRHFTPRFATP